MKLLQPTIDFEEADVSDSGYESTPESVTQELNAVFNDCHKREASYQSVAFSASNENFFENRTAKLKKVKYTQEVLELPRKYMKLLQAKYHERVVVSGEPWLFNDRTRSVFISDILTTCAVAAKEGDKTKADLSLNFEERVNDTDVKASCTADYTISLGASKVIVVEAKKCDMDLALRQNFAAMEVARVLDDKTNKNKENGDWNGSRTSQKFATMHLVCRPPEMLDHDPLDFPFDMTPIAHCVYSMLKRL
ncbi:hypothetical protein V7S43_017730 [Phytophthora oleae]|uniref:Uncharacterized protein n=1 Tax=Phytophthora oleae TaxID=2107226 RepID=A0ABD3ESS9_9STRA